MSQPPDLPPSYEWSVANSSPANQSTFLPAIPPSAPSAAPSPIVDELRNWFAAVDNDGNGHITAEELQGALLDEKYKPFSMSTCQMLVRMFDDNYNGEIELDEFVQLYHYVQKCRQVFLSFDDDRSGTIELGELRAGLHQLHQPHSFSETFCKRLMRRFSTHSRSGSLSLDNFIEVSAALSKQVDSHRSLGASEPFESFATRALFK